MERLRSYVGAQVDRLPVSAAAWVYNLRRTLRLLWPANRYPLSAPPHTLSCRPLFIVSSGRAGTTLLRSMLVAGGEIAIPPESHTLAFTALQFQAMQEQSWYNLVRLVISLFEGIASFQHWDIALNPVYVQARSLPEQERSLAKILDLVYLHYASVYFPQARLWGDQSPFNTMRLPWIQAVFPAGRYLHLLRDGRDVVASYKQKGDPLPWAVERWKTSVYAARKAEKQLGPAGFLEVRYEDLVTAPEQTLKAICDFAEIAFQPQMLDYWKLPTTLEHRYQAHHRNLQKPVFRSSIGSWQQRLTADEQALVNHKLAPLLHDLGYS